MSDKIAAIDVQQQYKCCKQLYIFPNLFPPLKKRLAVSKDKYIET